VVERPDRAAAVDALRRIEGAVARYTARIDGATAALAAALK
jgi:hypothetical protein